MYMAQNAFIFRECMNAGMDVLWAYYTVPHLEHAVCERFRSLMILVG